MKGLNRVRSLVAVSLLLIVLVAPISWAAGDAHPLQQGDGGSTPDGLVSVSGTVDVSVSQSSDDAEERLDTGQVYKKGDDLELGTDEGSSGTIPMMVGIRFAGIGIPQGAIINSAYIEFTASEVQEGATSVTILGEASDDAQTYKGDPNEISTRPKLGTSVPWNAIPPWSTVGGKYQTPDIKAIVQQIVSRPGWKPSNAMAFDISGTGRRTAWSYDGSSKMGNPAMAPRLVIDYAGQVACQTLNLLSNPLGAGQIATDLDPAPGCGANQYYQGTSVQLTAVPTGLNYYFGSWTGPVSNATSNPTTVVMSADQTVTANFATGGVACYKLTMIVDPPADPTAGEIRPTPLPDCGDGTTEPGKYKDGTLLSVDAVARGGWKFIGWSGALTGEAKPQALTMDADKTVIATFEATCRRITMKIDPPEGGTVQYTPPPNCEGDKWQPMDVVQLKGVQKPGYFFVKWTGDDFPGGETYDNPITVTMDSNKSIEAVFRASGMYKIWLPTLRK